MISSAVKHITNKRTGCYGYAPVRLIFTIVSACGLHF